MKIRKLAVSSLMVALAIAGLFISNTQAAVRVKKFSAERIADRIIIGMLSEDGFRKMDLTIAQRVEVFREIAAKRGWKATDTQLEQAITAALQPRGDSGIIQPLYSGACSQGIEQANGSSYAAFPYGQTTPNGSECGGDPDDTVLLYNTPNAPNTNADNVRWYSTLWWVRWTLSGCYSSLAANGLCSIGTRVCIGSCGQVLGSDLNYVYLWQQ